MEVILASQSPRRKELLKNIFDDFTIIPANIDENLYDIDELSKVKAERISKEHEDALIIAADTTVKIDNIVLNKPKDADEAYKMLKMLSNKEHIVTTIYTICLKNKGIFLTRKILSSVLFNNLSDETIYAYIKSGSPFDKAGGYGIQDKEYNLVKSIKGSLSNIIGLPYENIKEDLISLGILNS